MPALNSWSQLNSGEQEHASGLSFVFCVAVIWVAASFLVQDLEREGINAFVLTYIANSLFILLLPISALSAKHTVTPTPRSAAQPELEDKQLLDRGGSAQHVPFTADVCAPVSSWSQTVGNKQIRHAALVVAPLWFGAQLTFNLSLSMTNVTSNTILSSTSSLFTFALSCLLLGEKYTFVKLGSIVVCIAGVVMVTFGDSSHSEGRQSFVGDMLCLLSSLLYASYTIAIRQMLPNDENADVTTFFGFIGLLNLVFMAPVLIILWLTSVVQLQGMTAWLLLLAVCKGLFDNVLSDYLWARAVLLLGPTLATVGLSVQVPLAVAAEGIFGTPEWLHSHGSAAFMILGAIAVLMGFMGVSLSHTSAILQRYSHTSAIQQDASDNQADSEECEASMYRNDSVLPPDGSGGF
ncbi:hypothetical protein WJX77_002727 [Trebouxia sp. C0004]